MKKNNVLAVIAILVVLLTMPQTAFAAVKPKAQATTQATTAAVQKTEIEKWAEQKFGALKKSFQFDPDTEMLGGMTLDQFRAALAKDGRPAIEYWAEHGMPKESMFANHLEWLFYVQSYYYNKVINIGSAYLPYFQSECEPMIVLFSVFDEKNALKKTQHDFNPRTIYMITRNKNGTLYVSWDLANAYYGEKGFRVNGFDDEIYQMQSTPDANGRYQVGEIAYPGGDPSYIGDSSLFLMRWDLIEKAYGNLKWKQLVKNTEPTGA